MPRPRKTVEQRRALVAHARRHRNKKEELAVPASGDDSTSSGLHSGDDFEDMDGEELVGSLQRQMEGEIQLLEQLAMKKTSHDGLMRDISMQEWKRAESNRSLGYNGQSVRSKRRYKEMERKAEEDRERGKTLFVIDHPTIYYILLTYNTQFSRPIHAKILQNMC